MHGASEVVNPAAWPWRASEWHGRPWDEAVIYELHVGSFTSQGSFAALKIRLDYLVELGVTAIELMPVSDFPGERNWGYDGVLPFAPDSCYGRPDELKDLIQAAHRKNLMVFLDVVYNHFGPEGNYLHVYAPQFFTEHHHTPWGAAINFDDKGSEIVRQFFIHNALYWLEEYHLDGLRLDAVHAIIDDSSPDILEELAAAVAQGPGQGRHIHLILENDHNAAHYLSREGDAGPREYVAQWHEVIHHAVHGLLTGGTDGYYADYASRPAWYLGRCLAEGFAYQGESSFYRDGAMRGEPSGGLPPTAFVTFLQNHDQVGNRAFGERISMLASEEAVLAMVTIMLLAPSPPLLFMGEEFASNQPFQFFCDFGENIADAVAEGRRREFTRFGRSSDPDARETIPAPNAPATFAHSKLDWDSLEDTAHYDCLLFYQRLLALRHEKIIPRLPGIPGGEAGFRLLGESGLRVQWRMGDGSLLILMANLAETTLSFTRKELPAGGT